jgi:regulator of RNase E activity RraA
MSDLKHLSNATRPIVGAPVYPGDILDGAAEGVVAIPRHFADEVADEAFAAVQYEELVAARLRRGRPILRLFPATQDNMAKCEHWVAAGHPPLDNGLEK